MLREPRLTEKSEQTRDPRPQGRFRIEKLEERIAPRCHINPHGKEVGCGKDDGTK